MVATYFKLGIHTRSDLVCLEILGHLSNPILNCPKEWGLQRRCFGIVSAQEWFDLRLTLITALCRCSALCCELPNPKVVSYFNHSTVHVLSSVPQIDKSRSSFGDKSWTSSET